MQNGAEGDAADMALHDVTAYGEQVGETYDRVYGAVLDTDGAVERLVELADGGPVLELGVGTGRLALPLAGQGLEVTGVDSSPAMLEQLTTKARAAGMPLIEGDFADVVVGRPFRLVVLAFNTLFALPTQDAQVACFANAARHLEPGGRFVVEAWIHDRTWFRKNVGLWPRALGEGTAIVIGRDDPVNQRLAVTELHFSPGGVRTVEMQHRYAGPAELDLMARLAGLDLEHRWANWREDPFEADSEQHVSVYRRRLS
jgi:SAM-dependent methyltransferase